MRDPPHKELTAYGCWISPLTRFTGLHCGGLSSEAAEAQSEELVTVVVRCREGLVKGPALGLRDQ